VEGAVRSLFAEVREAEIYRDYRRRLDAQAVLDHYGAENSYEQSAADGTQEVIHSCLIDRVEPHHNNGDANPSAACNLDKKVYICYQWWGGDLFHLIAKMEGKGSLAEIVPLLSPFLTGTVASADKVKAELDKIFAKPAAYSMELPRYADRVLEPWLRESLYWASRGISPETIADFKLGFDPNENRVVFPHFFDGALVGWQKRITPETRPAFPKYRNSVGFPKSETLYNYDRAKNYSKVIVVESPMSVVRAHTLGFPNVVATFGAKITPHQIDLLRRWRDIYVWFDADPAGYGGEQKLVSGLYRHSGVRVVIPEPGRDAADSISDEQFLARISSAVPAVVRMIDYGRSDYARRR
jgi:hypothetical protein